MHRLPVRALAALVVALGLVVSAGAETKPENNFKHRHAVMDAMKGHVSAISLLAFNQVPDEGTFLIEHASALAALGRELPYVFPEGSRVEDSHALPAIWENPDKFAAAVDRATSAMAELDQAVRADDRRAIAGAFKNVGDACKGCHEDFREEHEHDD